MKKQCALFAALILACSSPAWNGNSVMAQSSKTQSQARTITGVVTDSKGDPLIGASVLVKGTTNGAATDVDGKFSLSATPGKILVISYVGCASKEVKVTDASSYNIKMDDSSTNLNEVVVTALGIKKDKKSLGYAVDDINSDELMKNKSVNPINSLSGKIAGVNITQSSGAAGAGT